MRYPIEKRDNFLDALNKSGGVMFVACEAVGLSRSTVYNWIKEDADFAAAVADIREKQVDFVESKLLERINAGDTTATIFYLKTQGKHRGWSERPPVEGERTASGLGITPGEFLRLVAAKREILVGVLKDSGVYTERLGLQCEVTARLLVRVDLVGEQVTADGYHTLNAEVSREGNIRESVNPLEKLYRDLLMDAQRSLQALGLNTDSREKPQQQGGALAMLVDALNDGKENDNQEQTN